MDAVIGNSDIIGNLFNRISRIKFTVEEFFAFDPRLAHSIPFGEMLARNPDNLTSEGPLFDTARECGQTVRADLIALDRAVKQHLSDGRSNSVNLNASTFFSPELPRKLDKLTNKHPKLVPQNLWLEMTEQEGIPLNYNDASLEEIGRMGYRLLIDDFDPFKAVERQRLSTFGPRMAGVKFDHTYAEIFRSGAQKKQVALGEEIHAIKDQFPNMIIIFEGIRGSDASLYPKLQEAGVQVVQQSGYRDDGPVKPINRREIELALA